MKKKPTFQKGERALSSAACLMSSQAITHLFINTVLVSAMSKNDSCCQKKTTVVYSLDKQIFKFLKHIVIFPGSHALSPVPLRRSLSLNLKP